MKRLFLIILFFAFVTPLKAKDIYVAQNQSGDGNGSGCGNAHDAAWFNNRSSWGSGSAQIGPGTTVHLCGNFNGSAGEQMLSVHGNGAAGHPITILFGSGTTFSAPYWSAQGAIWMDGSSFITVDGGSNGLIENTGNGTGRAHSNSVAVYAAGCNNCTVQHLTVANLYVRTSQSDLDSSQNSINCVYFNNANNFTISRVTCHDAGWAFEGFGNNFTLEFSVAYNIDHGLAFGPSGTSSGFSIHDNHIYNYANWDSPPDKYHHDGLHIWGQRGGRVTNGSIYNNRFDGDPGANITAHIYLQDSIENVAVFNNVFVVPSNRLMNILWFAAGTNNLPGGIATGNSAYNNFINGGAHRWGSALFVQGQHNFTAINNVLMGGGSDISISFGGSQSSSGINNNIYLDLEAEVGDHNSFNYQSAYFSTLSAWRGACRCDSGSKLVKLSQINANSLGQLLSGSAGIAAGTNLMNLANSGLSPLAQDAIGTARPTGGSWDVGAYQTVNGKPRPLAPSGLSATVN